MASSPGRQALIGGRPGCPQRGPQPAAQLLLLSPQAPSSRPFLRVESLISARGAMPAALFVLLWGLPPPPRSRRPLPRPRPVIPALSRRPPLARRWKPRAPLFRNGKLVPPLARRALWWHCRERAPGALPAAFSSAFFLAREESASFGRADGRWERQIFDFALEFIRVHQLLCLNGRDAVVGA